VELLVLDDAKSPWIKDWPSQVHALGPGISRYGYNPRLKPWIRNNAASFDAIVVNGVWRYLGCGVRDGLRGQTIPYFVIPHSMLNPWFQERASITSMSKVAMWRLAEWKVLRDARAVIFTCEEERRLATGAYKPYICSDDVLTVVGTAPPATHQTDEREMFFSYFPHLRRKRVVLYLGRLHQMKGCDLLIKAFSIVCSEDSDLNLVIAGPDEGRFVESLRKLAKRRLGPDRITWAGPIYREMKWAAFCAASLFALPSHCEAFPVALLEALGSGVPVLITDKINIWSYVASAEAGFVDSDTVEGTVRSLRRWLRLDDVELQRMRSNALKCFSEQFDARSNTSRFIAGLLKYGVRRS
jgi:glycosyltransferase involved in cell wall biosynthesis